MTRAQKQSLTQEQAVERALEIRGLSLLGPFEPESPQAVTAAAAAGDNSSSTQASPGSSTDQQPAAAADAQGEAAASSSDDSSSSSVFPSWIRGLLGDNRKRRSRAPAAKASPLTPTAAIKDEVDKREFEERQKNVQAAQGQGEGSKGTEDSQPGKPADGWGDTMPLFKDLALDDYGGFIKNDPGTEDFEAAPRPKTPMRGHAAFYSIAGFDQERVQYIRYEAHYLLISAMSQEDKLRIKLNPKFHKDAVAMQELSKETGFSLDVIRDLIVCFHKNRLEFKLLYDYRNAGGQMPPPHDTMQFEALKRRLVSQHEAGKIKKLLELRDKSKCELRKFNAFVTRAHMRQMCPQTTLPYGQCCGANNRLHAKAARKARKLLSAA